jgi:hypothetical protein
MEQYVEHFAYVLKYPSGEYMGIDGASLYPYPTLTLSSVQLFYTKDTAKAYGSRFPELGLKVYEGQLKLTEID